MARIFSIMVVSVAALGTGCCGTCRTCGPQPAAAYPGTTYAPAAAAAPGYVPPATYGTPAATTIMPGATTAPPAQMLPAGS